MVKINRVDVPGENTIHGIIIRLAPNNYTPTTFAVELQTRLREYTGSESFFVTVDSDVSNSGITIQNAAANYAWKLLTDYDLRRNTFCYL
jgi:hypothetical protein